MRSIVTIV